MIHSKKREDFKDENFNLTNYLEQELGEVLKKESLSSSNEYLQSVMEAIMTKKERLLEHAQKLSDKDSLESGKAKASRTYQIIKNFEDDYSKISNMLEYRETTIKDDLKFTQVLKKRLDKTMEQKEKVTSELFVLDLVKDMKMNESDFPRVQTFEDKMKFAKNVKELENLVTMYEKPLIPKFNQLQGIIEEEFVDRIQRELSENKFEFLPEIIDYFNKIQKEEAIFRIMCQQFIIKINFHTIPSSLNKQNVDNISNMLSNYFNLVETFYERRLLGENHIVRYLSEDAFQKFTGYFFEHVLSKYLEIILMKNLRNNSHQFFLEYLVQVHDLFANYASSFEKVKSRSIFLGELLQAYQSAALDKYYEEYFGVEEAYFKYLHEIYIPMLKKKLDVNFGTQMDETRWREIAAILESEKFQEYLIFIKKAIQRAALLCDPSFQAANIGKLITYSLSQFQGFFDFIIDKLIRSVPVAFNDPNFISPTAFDIAEKLYISMLRMNADQKSYVAYVKSSIYFGEINSKRKEVFERIREKLEDFTSRSVSSILKNISIRFSNPATTKRSQKEEFSVLKGTSGFVTPYLDIIKGYSNLDFQKNTEIIFYKEYIKLIEDIFLQLDNKTKDRLNFLNEFTYFFNIFSQAKYPEVEGDVSALQYLLLCLKSGERNIYRLIEPSTKDKVPMNKIAKYQEFLNKKT